MSEINYNWKDYIKRAKSEYTKDNSEFYIKALDLLKDELGNGFLKNSSINHPIHKMLSNYADWQVNEVIEFSKTLELLKFENSKTYQLLIEKLRPEKDCRTEGVIFVELARSCFSNGFGFEIKEEENECKIRTNDIFIKNKYNNEIIEVEVSTLDTSNRSNEISQNYYLISDYFSVKYPMLFCGKQKQTIDKDKLKNILFNLKNEAKNKEEVMKYFDENIELLVAPFSLKEDFEEERIKSEFSIEFIGKPHNIDESKRIQSKISSKIGQINSSNYTVFYIEVPITFLLFSEFSDTINALKTKFKENKKLLGIILFSYVLDEPNVFFNNERNVCNYFVVNRGYGYFKHVLFVVNESISNQLSQDTLTKFYSMLRT